jgi:hypothetical protein
VQAWPFLADTASVSLPLTSPEKPVTVISIGIRGKERVGGYGGTSMGRRIWEGAARGLHQWGLCIERWIVLVGLGGAVLGATVSGLIGIAFSAGILPQRFLSSLAAALLGALGGTILGAFCGAFLGLLAGGVVGVVEVVNAAAQPDRSRRPSGGPTEIIPSVTPAGRGDEVAPLDVL